MVPTCEPSHSNSTIPSNSFISHQNQEQSLEDPLLESNFSGDNRQDLHDQTPNSFSEKSPRSVDPISSHQVNFQETQDDADHRYFQETQDDADPRWISRVASSTSFLESQDSSFQDPPSEQVYDNSSQNSHSEGDKEVDIQPPMSSLNAQILKLSLGRRVGRPRKIKKHFDFFDCKHESKKQTFQEKA